MAICKARVRAFKAGCHNGSCWGCEDDLRTRAARAIEERFIPHLKGRAVCYTIATTPEHVRGRMAEPGVWADCRARFLKKLQENLGMVWAVERTDPAGKCADAEISGVYCDCSHCRKWHPHLNILWVRANGRGKLTETELWLMKTWWAEIIGAEFAWDGDYVRPIVDVQHKFTLDPADTKDREEAARRKRKLWKWFRYQGRTWPAWRKSLPNFIRIRWFGKFPTKPISEEKSEAKMRRLYRELDKAKEDGAHRLVRRLEKRIDKLRHPKPCRCGCDVIFYPQPEPNCRCCGGKVEIMPVLDAEEAAHWKQQGPEVARAELLRRRREERSSLHRKKFSSSQVEYWKRSVADQDLFPTGRASPDSDLPVPLEVSAAAYERGDYGG